MIAPLFISLAFLSVSPAVAQDAPPPSHHSAEEGQAPKERTILDTLGVNHVRRFVDQKLVHGRMTQAAGSAASTVFSPVGRAVKNGATAISDRWNGTSSDSTAQARKEEERQTALKIQALQYLVTLDSSSHSNIIETVAAHLDDPSEAVRVAALRGIQWRGNKAVHDPFAMQKQADQANSNGNYQNVGGPIVVAPQLPSMKCSCESCRCHRKIIDRLNAHMLALDDNGRLKERSPKVRDYAFQVIVECLDHLHPSKSVGRGNKSMEIPFDPNQHGYETLKPRTPASEGRKSENTDPELPKPKFMLPPHNARDLPRQ